MSISSTDKIKCLFLWCKNQTSGYNNVSITNFTSSWRDGLGFCAILHRYGPEHINFENLNPENVFENCRLAFEIGEQVFGIPALLDAKDMEVMKIPDRLSMITYLLQYYSTLSSKKPKTKLTEGPLSPIDNISDIRSIENKSEESTSFDSLHDPRDQLLCAICSKVIYFLEKLSIKEKCYHRSCYRESQLQNLEIRNRTLERVKKNMNESDNSFNKKLQRDSVSPKNKAILPLTNDENEAANILCTANKEEDLKSLPDDKNTSLTKTIDVKILPFSKSEDILSKDYKGNNITLHNFKSAQSLEGKDKFNDGKIIFQNECYEIGFNNNMEKEKLKSTKENKIIKETVPLKNDRDLNILKSLSVTGSRMEEKESNINSRKELIVSSTGIIRGGGEYSSLQADNNNGTLGLKATLPESDKISLIEDVKTDSHEDINTQYQKVNDFIETHNEKSNTHNDNKVRLSRLRSFSPNSTNVRPPSLDSHLDKRSSENIKSNKNTNYRIILKEQSKDQSSLSGSSTQVTSANASSAESLSKGHLPTIDSLKVKSTDLSDKIITHSLNTSISSLNSSFSKKRRAPAPPSSISKTESIQIRATSERTTSLKPESVYPEILNPFGEEDNKPKKNDSNPFAEYMTDPPSDTIKSEKPIPKPRKRTAPKLPLKEMIGINPNNTESHNAEDTRLTIMIENSDNPPKIPLPQEFHSLNDSTVLLRDKKFTEHKMNVVIEDKSVVINTESVLKDINNKRNYGSDMIKRSEAINRKTHLIEKSKSNDAINLLQSTETNKSKPPAPPRPPPLKRKVRSDKNDEFIPYELLYKELKEVNETQTQMEHKGRSLQEALNKINENDEGYESLLEEWLEIVENKNTMYSREHYLHEVLRRQELEDRHSDLEFELRILMGKQESLKTAAEKAREDELINQIIDTVNARAKMVQQDDDESSDKSSTKDNDKKKSNLKKLFTFKTRSNSVGKTIFRFNIQKNKTRNNKSIFYD